MIQDLSAFLASARHTGKCPACSREFRAGEKYNVEWLRHSTFTAQHLYDVRALAGNVGGDDLCRLFIKLGIGASPKGRVEIVGSALLEAEDGTPSYKSFSAWLSMTPDQETLSEYGGDLVFARELVAQYSGADWPAETPLYLAASEMLAAAEEAAFAEAQ